MKITAELLNVDGSVLAEGDLTFREIPLADDDPAGSKLFLSTLTSDPYEARVELPYATADRRCWYSIQVTISGSDG